VRRPLFLLLLAALALKAAVLASLEAHPLLQPAGDIDSGVYARLAADVARGDLLLRGPGPVPFFVSPLYIYFLAAIHALSAGSLLAVKLVQIALGTAAVGLVYGTARRLFGDRAALVAGILYALTGVVTFHEVLILQAALDPFLTALALYLLAVGLTEGSSSLKVNGGEAEAAGGARRGAAGAGEGGLGIWLAAGAAFGLLSLNRPNALLCVAAIGAAFTAASLVARRRSSQLPLPFEENPLRTLRFAVAYLAGTGVLVALPLARNLIVSGEPVLISSHGGLNFLVGNGPGANGVYRALPGITPDIGGQAQDAKRVAETAEGRTLSTREVSAHFAKVAWTWIRERPAAAAGLLLKKIWYLLSRDEAPLNFSFPWYRERSVALKLLAVGPGLLVPLGGAGLVLALLGAVHVPRRAVLVWASFVPAYILSVAAFFVATRYRLPLLVALAVLAGAGIIAAWDAIRARERRRLAVAAAVALPLAAISLWPTGLWDGGADEDMHWALYLIERGEAAEAARLASATATVHPDPGVFWFRVGKAWAAAGRMDDAISALEKGRAIEPHPPATERALAGAHESRGVDRVLARDALGALPDLEAAAVLAPEEPGILLNLAAALAEKGERARARDLAQRALALKPGYEKAEALLEALR
jgi:4-amino-4-deoxy-L-arabinose transferase-like glycosyltransferase